MQITLILGPAYLGKPIQGVSEPWYTGKLLL